MFVLLDELRCLANESKKSLRESEGTTFPLITVIAAVNANILAFFQHHSVSVIAELHVKVRAWWKIQPPYSTFKRQLKVWSEKRIRQAQTHPKILTWCWQRLDNIVPKLNVKWNGCDYVPRKCKR